jgi:hypothetical protein
LNPTFAADTGTVVLSVTKKFIISVDTLMPTREFDNSFFMSQLTVIVALRVFRLSCAGVTDISADYNTNILKAEDTMNYLNTWMWFILLVLD